MSSSNKIDLQRYFAAGVYLSEAQTSFSPPPLPPVTLYTYSHREGGKGERVEPERLLEGQQFTKLGWTKCQHDWPYLQSVNSEKHLPQSPFTGQFFRWQHFAFLSILLISPSKIFWTIHWRISFGSFLYYRIHRLEKIVCPLAKTWLYVSACFFSEQNNNRPRTK